MHWHRRGEILLNADWRHSVARAARSGEPRPMLRTLVISTEESENRILGSNAYSHCQPVADENREAIRTTSMMDDCYARALTPMRKSAIAVLSPRLFSKKPFCQNSKGSLISGTECAVERAVQTHDFEDSTLRVIIGGKPLLAKRLRKFKHLRRNCPYERLVIFPFARFILRAVSISTILAKKLSYLRVDSTPIARNKRREQIGMSDRNP